MGKIEGWKKEKENFSGEDASQRGCFLKKGSTTEIQEKKGASACRRKRVPVLRKREIAAGRKGNGEPKEAA